MARGSGYREYSEGGGERVEFFLGEGGGQECPPYDGGSGSLRSCVAFALMMIKSVLQLEREFHP